MHTVSSSKSAFQKKGVHEKKSKHTRGTAAQTLCKRTLFFSARAAHAARSIYARNQPRRTLTHRIGTNVPRPHGHGIPLLDFETRRCGRARRFGSSLARWKRKKKKKRDRESEHTTRERERVTVRDAVETCGAPTRVGRVRSPKHCFHTASPPFPITYLSRGFDHIYVCHDDDLFERLTNCKKNEGGSNSSNTAKARNAINARKEVDGRRPGKKGSCRARELECSVCTSSLARRGQDGSWALWTGRTKSFRFLIRLFFEH
jgi:hypothetical protein